MIAASSRGFDVITVWPVDSTDGPLRRRIGDHPLGQRRVTYIDN